MRRASHLLIETDLDTSFNNLDSTFRGEGLSVAYDTLRIDGERVAMEVCLSNLIIEEKIGQGACSSVHRAVHKKTKQLYAVKMFNVHNKQQRSQLLHEVHLLKDVACEALVSFSGAFYTDGVVGMILEYMDQGSLDKFTRKTSESALAGIVYQVLWGLGYLHHDKNVHRDVKPGNTLMNSQGYVKLSDFGISRQLDGTAVLSNTYVGTFRFMSPERLLGEGYNFKGDIWSVGVMMIELWTGGYPFEGHLSSPFQLLERIRDTDVCKHICTLS